MTQEVLAPDSPNGNALANPSLSEQERTWCLEFLIDFDATGAAKRAGYPVRKCAKAGVANMRNDLCRKELDRLKNDLLYKAHLTPEAILLELAKIGFSNIDDYLKKDTDGNVIGFDFSQCTRQQMAAISELTIKESMEGSPDDKERVREIKLKLHGKREALVDLGKHYGVFKEQDLNFNFALVLSPDEMNA